MKLIKSTNQNIVFSLLLLFVLNPIVMADNTIKKYSLKLSMIAMKPLFENDQWFVTDNGYHLHPRTEDFTPGLYFGVERTITKQLGMEIGLLIGFPPATLGVIDQFSSTGREYLGTKRYSFFALLLSPNLYLIRGDISVSISPIIGYAVSTGKTLTPSFGPTITWLKNSEFTYGAKIGMKIRTRIPNLYVCAEVFKISLNARLESAQTEHNLIKEIGPLGITIGISNN